MIFGHTHRAGPLAGDDAAEWALPAGGAAREHRLAGSTSRASTRDGTGGPYWPGGAVEIDDDGVPRLVRLLDDVPAARLLA